MPEFPKRILIEDVLQSALRLTLGLTFQVTEGLEVLGVETAAAAIAEPLRLSMIPTLSHGARARVRKVDRPQQRPVRTLYGFRIWNLESGFMAACRSGRVRITYVPVSQAEPVDPRTARSVTASAPGHGPGRRNQRTVRHSHRIMMFC